MPDKICVVGAPAHWPEHMSESVLISCSQCPHRAWFSGDFSNEIKGGADTICFDCAMERPGDARVVEKTIRHLEMLGMPRGVTHQITMDLDVARKAKHLH